MTGDHSGGIGQPITASLLDHKYGGSHCQHTSGRCLDDFVAVRVLAALTPASAQVSIAAAEQIQSERAELDKIWRLRLERAEFEVERARRCATGSRRGTGPGRPATPGRALPAFPARRPPTLTEQDKAAITAAAADLAGLWRSPTTTDTDRKQIIRSVIDEITVTVRGRSELVDLTITWAGAQHTTATLRRPIQRLEDLSYYPQLTARISQLADTRLHPEHIADRLTAEGWPPPEETDRSATEPYSRSCAGPDTPSPTNAPRRRSIPTTPHAKTNGGSRPWPPNSA
jgi:hypothetical protein